MKIVVERGVTRQLSELPEFSIALDGYVQGPEVDLAHRRISCDHHAGCIRMFTSATCQQVLDMLLLGFDPTPYTAYINDVDGDTVLSVWLLQTSSPGRTLDNEWIKALVAGVGKMDAHGPAYPVGTMNDVVRAFYDVVMAPVNRAHRHKTYATADLKTLLDECLALMQPFISNPRSSRADSARRMYSLTSEKTTKSGTVLAVVTSQDFVFDLLYEAGITAALCYRQLPDGSWEYTLGKKSDLVDVPVGPHTTPGTMLHALAQAEPGWGGGSTIGGAPRNADGSRSKLSPNEVLTILLPFYQ